MNLHEGVPYKKVDCFTSSSTEIIPIDSNLNKRGKKKKEEMKKNISHLAGLEPATFRLTAERANQLRHKCNCFTPLTNTVYMLMYLNVSLSVDVSKYFLEAPETASTHTEHGLHTFPRLALKLLLDISQYGPKQLYHSNYQRTKGDRPRVKPIHKNNNTLLNSRA